MEKGTIKLCWEKDVEASGYIIEQCFDEENKELVRIENINITSVIISNILSGKENHFKIQYFRKEVNGQQVIYKELHRYCFFSRKRTVTYECPTPILVSAQMTNRGVEIRWELVRKCDFYLVVKRTKNGKWTRVGITSNNYYLDEKTDLSQKYMYSVRCISEDGKEVLSSFDTKGISVQNV